MSNEIYAVIDALNGDYNEFDGLDRARIYARDCVDGKDEDERYCIKTVMVRDVWDSDDLLPGE